MRMAFRGTATATALALAWAAAVAAPPGDRGRTPPRRPPRPSPAPAAASRGRPEHPAGVRRRSRAPPSTKTPTAPAWCSRRTRRCSTRRTSPARTCSSSTCGTPPSARDVPAPKVGGLVESIKFEELDELGKKITRLSITHNPDAQAGPALGRPGPRDRLQRRRRPSPTPKLRRKAETRAGDAVGGVAASTALPLPARGSGLDRARRGRRRGSGAVGARRGRPCARERLGRDARRQGRDPARRRRLVRAEGFRARQPAAHRRRPARRQERGQAAHDRRQGRRRHARPRLAVPDEPRIRDARRRRPRASDAARARARRRASGRRRRPERRRRRRRAAARRAVPAVAVPVEASAPRLRRAPSRKPAARGPSGARARAGSRPGHRDSLPRRRPRRRRPPPRPPNPRRLEAGARAAVAGAGSARRNPPRRAAAGRRSGRPRRRRPRRRAAAGHAGRGRSGAGPGRRPRRPRPSPPRPSRLRAAGRRALRGGRGAARPGAAERSRRPAQAYRSRTIAEAQSQFTGEPISLDLKDADIKDVFRTISQLTGLNIVIDPEVRGTVTVQLEDVPWDQALDLILKQNSLGYVLENNIMRIATTAKLQAEEGDRARLAEARQAAEPTRTVIKKLSYAKAGEIVPVLQSVMSKRGAIVVDQRTNTLIIRETPTYLPAVLQLIDNLDTATPQVVIESRIVETTKSLGRSLGINWRSTARPTNETGNTTNLIFPNSVAGGLNVGLGNGPTVASLVLGNILNTFNLDVALTAAENQGLAQDHLVAEGHVSDEHAGPDPVGRADSGPDDRQQHDDRHLRRRDAQARRHAADHGRGHDPADGQRHQARAGGRLEPRARPERPADDPRVPRPGARQGRRHDRHRRHLPDQRPGPVQHDPGTLEDSRSSAISSRTRRGPRSTTNC